jgi:hypothetical protein
VTDLGRELDALGTRLVYPPTPGLERRVVARLEADGRTRRRRRVVAVAVVAAVAAVGGLLAVSPAARSAVARWLEVAGVRIERRDALPEIPRRTTPFLGARTTIARAEDASGLTVLVPRELGRPDAVFFRLYPPGGSVALVYGTPQRPRLVLTQYRGASVEPVSLKVAGPQTRVELLEVAGARAVWLEGAPHLVYTFVEDEEYPESLDLAGNVLVWERGARAFRLEADVSRERAVEIAESVR